MIWNTIEQGRKAGRVIPLHQMSEYWTCQRNVEIYELRKKIVFLYNATMKARAVEHLKACHLLEKSSSERCRHLPLIL